MPKALDHDRIQEIYGTTDGDDEIDENITSTALPGVAEYAGAAARRASSGRSH